MVSLLILWRVLENFVYFSVSVYPTAHHFRIILKFELLRTINIPQLFSLKYRRLRFLRGFHKS